MKLIKKFDITKSENKMISPLCTDICIWFSENTMIRTTGGQNQISPFTPMFQGDLMMTSSAMNNVTKDEPLTYFYDILVKNIAIKNEDSNWEIYDKVCISVMKSFKLSDNPMHSSVFGIPCEYTERVAINSFDSEPKCICNLEGLFENL